ncbi:hypothetical protein BBO99_00007738 [Phytophthora kernoviae]|uniref:Kinesin motor domain-containing protein n=2 Tax=Phytophthora kernoviae TaxID=325452 RepID=A0A421GGY8_9STRA|nr:hypothetical protein G195_008759 [Phytophthora kernoviae 00238/432]KAG2518639.1 hypothetical protein JM16_007304 [Phytophthora kernoviae]KAG2520245.1 hypothetical protein JM18_007186 [Phytophthora kernoviae]RLN76208.1 hypothetical protein BBO99_00007738 [Phytophthora kernoviae]
MMRPHMRIFYLSWMSAITGFFGWYAIPPLMLIIKVNLGLTDGEVLNSDIASTASTIFSRIASGPLLDRFGPQVVQSYVLWLGAIPIICAAFVNSATGLIAVRFFIGLVGCIFVTGQYWTTITFARNVAGTANAITGGLGLSGIGYAFLVIPFVFKALKAGGVSEDMSWRLAIALPAVLMLIAGTVIRFAVDSCPTGDFEELKETKQQAQQTANQQNPSQQAESTGLVNSFKIVLSDKNVLVMIMHYAACFGTELQLNNMGALYFYKEFLKDGCTDSSFCSLLSTTSAATVASSFGLMNMFARALGGLASDAVNRRLGLRGRRYAQFTLLCILGSLVLVLSKMHSLGSCIALYVLAAIAAQALGGSTYGIVPYLNEQHTGTVNGLVGAGGNFGGAIFGIIFRVTSSYNAGMFYMSILVQVAPLPHTADFHAGKVLELGVITAPTQEREEAYIPVALARAQLSKVVADMHAMKSEQVQKLATLEMPTQTEEEEVKIEAEIKTEEKTAEDIPTVPALPLDKIIYESEVEVTRERNVVLIRSKSALQEAKQKLDVCAKNKKTAKTAVKIWLSAFQAQHGREPAIEEKAQVKDKYLAFKEAEEAYSAQKTLVATLKQQHHELALRIDASSRCEDVDPHLFSEAKVVEDEVNSTGTEEQNEDYSEDADFDEEESEVAIAEAKDDDDEQTEQDQDEEVDDSVEDESQDVKEDAARSLQIVQIITDAVQSLEKKQEKAEQREQEKKSHKKKSAPPQSTDKGPPTASGGSKALEDAKQKLRALERQTKADRVKISQLEAALAKAENQLASGGGGGGGGGNAAGGTGSAASDRRVVDMEKKHKKALDESEKVAKKEIASLASQLQAAQRASQTLQEQASALQKELGVVGGKAKQLGQLETEVNELREQAALVAPLNNELREAKVQYATLETSYREEQTLRKKYYNQIEDMKGKIRVYARCRPMSGPELERGCAPCVKFLDEFSLEVSGGSRATKTFAYDQVFSPAISQIQVFEDTKNLLQSAIDGYNVCIFAYGQTGSGKTFTMTGCENDPGLSPRAIHHLFALASESKANFTISFQATMLELYNDTLIDLFHLMEGGGSHDNKLDIKKNEKGMVVVSNATLKKCSSPEQTLRLFEAANKKRQVGATKMNAESSRSHSIFSLLVESFNNTTKTTTIGKLSLVDLAGSERAGKTGATADRLKEAQAINKSLSALGDVISALSTNEKFIPYRNNKLTQLMQDSLGGNAKTLMFVNISPADYNTEETVTSLTYASRVKLITNNANKNSESEQVNRLKAIIKQLRAGKTDVDFDGALD